MSYRFCLGASGAGKTTMLHRETVRRAAQALERLDFDEKYIFIVPDQFTMQTQKELVLAAGERGGIMNIDVLSFGRLSHRVFEEAGADGRGALDDMGKSLILRRLAGTLQGDLRVLGQRMRRPGMVTEVKSVISEFMQYGISADDAGELASYAASHGQGGLAARLQDIQLLYRAFLKERDSRYLTGEERLELLAEWIPRSELLRGSTVIFDGFTGFTPVQYQVILALMLRADVVIFTLDYAQDGGTPLREVMAGAPYEEQDLFYLTRQTVDRISRLARRTGVPHGEDILIGQDGAVPHRFAGNPAMAHLERALFRSPVQVYEPDALPSEATGPAARTAALPVHLIQATSPGQEVRQMCIRIRRLIAQKGYHYRDFAVVTGDLAAYEDEIRVYAERYDLPVYIDTRRAVMQNPLTETIRSALKIGGGDYSYETVFRFLRSGLTGMTAGQIDILENYCLARGISSRRRWETAFEGSVEPTRQAFLRMVQPLRESGHKSAPERTRALYRFLVCIHAGEQMSAMAQRFRGEGQDALAMEYEQIYREVMHLLDELYELPGEEPMSAKEYLELAEAGLSEIRLGTLPQQVDRIPVGDIERTRLSEVKVLFFLGVNDGSIPKGTSRGGLLSDLDREFLKRSDLLENGGMSLAPSPREKIYTQRLYLYMNMTKPSQELYVSYTMTAGDGGSLRPSYLIGQLRQMLPQLETERPEEAPVAGQMTAVKDASGFLAAALRDYADGRYLNDARGRDEILTIYGFCAARDPFAVTLRRAAFRRYRPESVSPDTARRLYGRSIRGSVTRLELAAQCYLRQFLRYGLRLEERELYTFGASDAGTILHDSIRRFGLLLQEKGIAWTAYTPEQGRQLAAQALRETAGQYHQQVLYDTARGTYQERRMQRVLERTVDTLQYQLQQGEFVPAALEQEFGTGHDLSFALRTGGRVYLQGRIDRVDLAADEDRRRLYVKIVDYKSGDTDLDPERMRMGLQLQLLLYMYVQTRRFSEENPQMEIVPAGMLYSRFADPVLSGKEADAVLPAAASTAEMAREQAQDFIRRRLRPKGMIGAETDILQRFDRTLAAGADSSVIPVKLLKGGDPASSSRVYTREEYQTMTASMRETICRLAEGVLEGRADAAPVRYEADRTACTWCPYRNACGFDPRTPGYMYRDLHER